MTDTRQITQTQALLAAIPALAAKLPRFLTSGTPTDSETPRTGHSKSRPPLDVGILDLLDGRDIEWWVKLAIDEMVEQDTEPVDPPPSRTRSLGDDCRWLANNTAWIIEHNPDTQAHLAVELGHPYQPADIRSWVMPLTPACRGFATEIRAIHWAYRRAAGDTPGPRISCNECGNRAFIGDGNWMICTEVEEHARSIRSIEHEHRYQPAETTQQITTRFGIPESRIYDWRRYRKISPARAEGRTLYWWPWDVFCLLNPTVAEAINARDEHATKEPA